MNTILPNPKFDFDQNNPPFTACLRPYRENSFRLDFAQPRDKLLVHNYGHGGAGITMSWGCAAEVRDIIADHAPAGAGKKVAVLGAGIMGLTVATLLVQRGLQVTIYTKEWQTELASCRAGGQFAPSYVNYDQSPDGNKAI